MLLSQGQSVPEACKKIEISQSRPTIAGAKSTEEFVSIRPKRLKELERENTRLKKLVADQALDNAILKEAASGNF